MVSDTMNLVIQGDDVSTPDLKELHRLSRGAAIERISGEAFRITRADPATRFAGGGARDAREAGLRIRGRKAARSATSASSRWTWIPR